MASHNRGGKRTALATERAAVVKAKVRRRDSTRGRERGNISVAEADDSGSRQTKEKGGGGGREAIRHPMGGVEEGLDVCNGAQAKEASGEGVGKHGDNKTGHDLREDMVV